MNAPTERSISAHRARNTIGFVFTIGILALAVGFVLYATGQQDYPENTGLEGLGVFLVSIGGIATWFSTTAWAVWAGVQAARRD